MTTAPPIPRTEAVHDRAIGLDTQNDEMILATLLDGHRKAVDAVKTAIPALSAAARLGAEALAAGGRLIYLGAGSPALMSMADALEVPATYGIPYDRIVLVLADWPDLPQRLNGVREDDGDAAVAELRALDVGADDCVIATSASGSTPYTVSGLAAARMAGARTVGVAGNADAPLFSHADVAVLLDTGAEVISGSTRMAAGTAQKVALNMLSTLIGVRLGHVYDGLMVNMRADNDKLRGRAARIVSTITGASTEAATAALRQSDGDLKPAIVIAAGATSLTHAAELLASANGNVRGALGLLRPRG